uniref:Uncharacterized protein n=1 Tax=Arundo donax TaxID=35708 RepID=A0A0A9A2N1_ARUDO
MSRCVWNSGDLKLAIIFVYYNIVVQRERGYPIQRFLLSLVI